MTLRRAVTELPAPPSRRGLVDEGDDLADVVRPAFALTDATRQRFAFEQLRHRKDQPVVGQVVVEHLNGAGVADHGRGTALA